MENKYLISVTFASDGQEIFQINLDINYNDSCRVVWFHGKQTFD